MNTTDTTQLTADIADTKKRLDKLRDGYTAKLLKGQTTRAQTTTYNARSGELAERLDKLRELLRRAYTDGFTTSREK